MVFFFLICEFTLPKKNFPGGAQNKVFENIMTESVRWVHHVSDTYLGLITFSVCKLKKENWRGSMSDALPWWVWLTENMWQKTNHCFHCKIWSKSIQTNMTVRILNVLRDFVVWDFHHKTKQKQKNKKQKKNQANKHKHIFTKENILKEIV